MSDSSKAPAGDAPRLAATVILVRERAGTGELEIYLQRRHHKASFMSSAFVFPGGTVEPLERDLRATTARELFEEAGVLLSPTPVAEETRDAWHTLVLAGSGLGALMAAAGASFDLEALRYFAHWITPSREGKRFSAVFYLARMPAGQTATLDNKEMVEEMWVTPDEALASAAELRLPPPQIRTFFDLREPARAGMDAIWEAAAFRAAQPHPILPRVAALGPGEAPRLVLLLPWDPEYQSRGMGDGLVMPAHHPLAVGPDSQDPESLITL